MGNSFVPRGYSAGHLFRRMENSQNPRNAPDQAASGRRFLRRDRRRCYHCISVSPRYPAQHHTHNHRSDRGSGIVQRMSAVRWGIARNIVWAWVLTIPCSAFFGALLELAAYAPSSRNKRQIPDSGIPDSDSGIWNRKSFFRL